MTRALLALTAAAAFAAVPSSASALNVYAASSLRDAFPAITGSPSYNFGGSNTLQAQIERGAPADVFASASPDEARALFKEGLCSRPVTFATNKLVLIVPSGNPGHIRSVYTLRQGGRRLSIGTAGVPIGDYTRLLLRRMRLSDVLDANTVSQERDVAGVSAKVALGSADAGFVYHTDALATRPRTTEIRLPKWAQPAVRYDGCVVKRPGADMRAAQAYLNKLRADEGRRVLTRHGFGLPGRR